MLHPDSQLAELAQLIPHEYTVSHRISKRLTTIPQGIFLRFDEENRAKQALLTYN